MSKPGTTVFVRKGGFLSALALGVFGTISMTILCASSIAIYGMSVADSHLREFVAATPSVVHTLTEWRKALPPALLDAANDRRAPEYREQVDVSVKLVAQGSRQVPVVEVVNRGDRLISLMSLRVAIEDELGLPVHEHTTFAATPLSVESEWRGPLLPGSRRRFKLGAVWTNDHLLDATVEVTELRIWEAEPHGGAIIPSDAIPASMPTTAQAPLPAEQNESLAEVAAFPID